MTTVGRVRQLWIFPVKSMAGTSVESADVVDGGLAGDRAWAVVDDAGQTVTAGHEPRLREVGTRLLDGELRLDVPGAQAGLGPEAAGEALSVWLGRPVHLAHREGAGFVDVAPVHVVSRTSMTDAEHAKDCDSCDIRAPRANLVLDLEPSAPGEQTWVGSTVAVGDVRLHVVRRPEHCLGAYADVAVAGTVRVGDVVAR